MLRHTRWDHGRPYTSLRCGCVSVYVGVCVSHLAAMAGQNQNLTSPTLMGVALLPDSGTRSSAPSAPPPPPPPPPTLRLYDSPSTCTAFFPMMTQHQVEAEGLKVSARCSRLTVLDTPREKKDEGGTAWLRLRDRGREEKEDTEERGGEGWRLRGWDDGMMG